MEYSEEFATQLSHLEACAMRLVDAETGTEEHRNAQSHYCTLLDDLCITFAVNASRIRKHADSVAQIYHEEDETTALDRISDQREQFLEELYPDYTASTDDD